MGSQFAKFEAVHGAAEDVVPVPDDVVEQYRGRLPDELLAEWQATGWCSYADGFIWLVDPGQFDGEIARWLPDEPPSLVFLRTAFGSLGYWNGEKAQLLDVTDGHNITLLKKMSHVFDYSLAREGFLEIVMDRDYFREALPRLGRLAADECYGYFPPKAMGGDGTPDTLQKVKLREHLDILAGL